MYVFDVYIYNFNVYNECINRQPLCEDYRCLVGCFSYVECHWSSEFLKPAFVF